MNQRYPNHMADAEHENRSSAIASNRPSDSTAHAAGEKLKPALAVALHYNGRGAPKITAKGGGLVAQRIIDTARQHGVPLEENPSLAGALSRIDLGSEVPRELWVAVAQVLAFAWSLSGRTKS